MKEMKVIEPEEFRKKFEEFIENAEGYISAGLVLETVEAKVFPYRGRGNFKVEQLVPSLIFTIRSGGERLHRVVFAWTESGFKIWCADGIFVFPSSKYAELYDEYVKLCKEAGIKEEHIIERDAEDDPCIFWRRKDCKHVRFVMLLLKENKERFFPPLEELRKLYFSAEQEENRYSLEGYLKALSFKAHVLIEGEQGSGKTYTAYRVADALKEKGEAEYVVIGQGDNGVETTDLLGCYIKAPDGSLVWKDGVLTEAFRKAQSRKTILLFDEFYRLRDREKDIFVRALTVYPDGKLRLRTGRVVKIEDGVAQEEVLEVPKENLWVIVTTNVGSQFSVDEADPALQERFVILRKDTEENELKEILTKKCEEYGIAEKEEVVRAMVRFWKGTKRLFTAGELSGYATTRTLVRAVEIAPEKSIQGVKEALWMQRYLWIGRDSYGFPVPEQEETVREVLEKSFR